MKHSMANKILLSVIFCTALLYSVDVQAQWPFKSSKKELRKQLQQQQHINDSLRNVINQLRHRDVSSAYAAKNDSNDADVLDQGVFGVDYTADVADSLAHELQLRQSDDAFDNFFKEYICEPSTLSDDKSLDSLYEARLKCIVTPINLPYNSVIRSYIQTYTSKYSVMHRVMPLSKYYFPMIDEELIKAGLPIELHAMAIIESALNPSITSRMGAGGLWQFMPSTGKAYGLTINSMVDERFDPVKSTRAACRYMKDLYNMYDDWGLALAAYNCGPGNVNKALAATGGNPKSFWEVYWHLPSETRGYVPAFVAALYVYNYHESHNINSNDPPMPLAVDTVLVNKLMHFDQIATTIDVDKQTLQMLNPQYKLDIIPAVEKEQTLVLPANRLVDFVNSKEAIYAKDSTYLGEYLNPSTVAKKMEETKVTFYKVKKGDTLGAIARRHHVTTKQIMKWNNLKNADKLSIGQRLRIEQR